MLSRQHPANPAIIDRISRILLHLNGSLHSRSPFPDKHRLLLRPHGNERFPGNRTQFPDDPFPHVLVECVELPGHDHDAFWYRFNVPGRDGRIDPHRLMRDQPLFSKATGEEGLIVVKGQRGKSKVTQDCRTNTRTAAAVEAGLALPFAPNTPDEVCQDPMPRRVQVVNRRGNGCRQCGAEVFPHCPCPDSPVLLEDLAIHALEEFDKGDGGVPVQE